MSRSGGSTATSPYAASSGSIATAILMGMRYENMGWKDAADAVVYPDGRQVRQPKALCELQGYVFDAWMRTGELFDALGEAARARELRRRAVELQDRFEERFWCEGI